MSAWPPRVLLPNGVLLPHCVLIYVQHLLGVGHVKRAASLARAMTDDGLTVHVVLGGMPVPLADFGPAVLHQLPPARAADMSFTLLLDAQNRVINEAWRRARKAQLLELETALRPDVIITEHFPFGRAKFAFELIPLFEQARRRAAVKILASVDKPDAAKLARMMAWITTWYDGILVHSDETVIPFGATFPATTAIADKLLYTGYVVDDLSPASSGVGRRSENGTNEIIVSVGGGAVGEQVLRAALAAADLIPAHTWRLLVGANLPEPVFQSPALPPAPPSTATPSSSAPGRISAPFWPVLRCPCRKAVTTR
jgi:predicted glycosyltransferase